MTEFKVPKIPPPAPTPKKVETSKVEIISTKQTTSDEESSRRKKKPAAAPVCPYAVPLWSALPSQNDKYGFEILKSGQIIGEVNNLQKKEYWTFGRQPGNDNEMAHPTISRYHAILQYKPKDAICDIDDSEMPDQPGPGWYIYDLGSTHGTFLNKQLVPPRAYVRMRVGHMLRLGSSTRTFILQGPAEDEEPESPLTVTELKEQREQQVAEAVAEAERKAAESAERERNEGVNWGMGEDADEETDLTHNPYASTNNEDLFFDDPKRTLRGYFEREGLMLEYKCDEISAGSFVCRVELPLDDSNGRPIIAEVVHKGRKKDCVAQCALEACRVLDRHGALRQANQEPLKRKKVSKKDSSDEDEFWDRTGDVERKKQRKASTATSVALTYEALIKQEADCAIELHKVETEIKIYKANKKSLKAAKEKVKDADLDSFMNTLTEDGANLDKTQIRKLRLEQQRIENELIRLDRLIAIAKPVDLNFTSIQCEREATEIKPECIKRPLPLIGKRNQFSKFKVLTPPATITSKTSTHTKVFDDEEDETLKCIDKKDEELDPNVEQGKLNVEKKETSFDTKSETSTAVSNLPESSVKKTFNIESESAVHETELTSIVNEIEPKLTADREKSNANGAQSDEGFSRKKRQRTRPRNKQQNDDDDEHESSEKYAKWMPPENQTGDGFTALNEKYGY